MDSHGQVQGITAKYFAVLVHARLYKQHSILHNEKAHTHTHTLCFCIHVKRTLRAVISQETVKMYKHHKGNFGSNKAGLCII